MGASHARLLVAEGAKVVLGDLLDDEGAALAKELGDAARYIHLNVTSYADWEAAVSLAVSDFGGLDVLINNAGIANFGSIEDYSLEDWDAIIGESPWV
jgi:3alpha(or 20beta)-hydroxysteroid dehydrogenase